MCACWIIEAFRTWCRWYALPPILRRWCWIRPRSSGYVLKAAKRVFGVSEFHYYCIADGLTSIFKRYPGRVIRLLTQVTTQEMLFPSSAWKILGELLILNDIDKNYFDFISFSNAKATGFLQDLNLHFVFYIVISLLRWWSQSSSYFHGKFFYFWGGLFHTGINRSIKWK